jgi:hypothetical protein
MLSLKENDTGVPGGVYLCQVNEHVSCGACCGLYNVRDASRNTLAELLEYRTRRFSKTPRDVDAILGFAEEILGREPRMRPYPGFHHCPYIGLVGDGRSRVGCLLHPLADGNGGVDFRGLSYYGGLACRTYFCPACKALNPVYKQILRAVADDWHTYGLIVTETALVDAFFQELEKRLGRRLEPGDILGDGDREALIRRFIGIRRSWPFRARPEKLCNYFFEDRSYPRPPVDYGPVRGALVEPVDRSANGTSEGSAHAYGILFRELESTFASEKELAAATRIFDRLFDRLVKMIHTPPHKGPRGG